MFPSISMQWFDKPGGAGLMTGCYQKDKCHLLHILPPLLHILPSLLHSSTHAQPILCLARSGSAACQYKGFDRLASYYLKHKPLYNSSNRKAKIEGIAETKD